MAKSFKVDVFRVGKSGDLDAKICDRITLAVAYEPVGVNIVLKGDLGDGRMEDLVDFPVTRTSECARIGSSSYLFNIKNESFCFKFKDESESKHFHHLICEVKQGQGSVFTDRTEDSSAVQYFQFYGYLSQQQNMMQDYVRTGTYRRAILVNQDDVRDKVVLDVGAGSGILSFFAVQAGAKRVYAVEASSMAQHAEVLVAANNLKDKIKVIAGKIEEITLPEMVDIIISEPMGYMLYNERMIETFLHAKKWLKPEGVMFPSRGDLHVAPFMDEALYVEQIDKASFWVQSHFHGVDLRALKEAAVREYFRQPIVDTFDIRICTAKSVRHIVDFGDADETDLHRIEIPLEFFVLETGPVHGLAFWFDVAFIGSTQTIWLSTAPTEPLTHWYQVRCLFESPIFAKVGQMLTGQVTLNANQRQSYDVTIDLCIEGKEHTRAVNKLDLKNPYFRYTGQPVNPPPGTNTTSPSEAHWETMDTQALRHTVNIINGISGNGLAEVEMESQSSPSNSLISHPNIHPGSISSTGRQLRTAHGPSSVMSTGQAQLIGGGISPTLFPSAINTINGLAANGCGEIPMESQNLANASLGTLSDHRRRTKCQACRHSSSHTCPHHHST